MTKVGRPSKGFRMRITTRVDPEVHRQATTRALTAGVTVSEWVADLVKREVAR